MHGLRRHSIASSTGSLTDDLALASSLASHDGGYAYGAHPDQSMRSSFSDIEAASPYVGLSRTEQPAVPTRTPPTGATSFPGSHGSGTTGRTRARAFSFLSVAGQPTAGSPSALSPATGDTPFVGGAYDFALAADEFNPSDEAEDDEVEASQEMRALGGGSSGAKVPAASSYRMRFQPLETHELAWMAASAAVVTGLTVTAAVLAFVG